MDAWLHRCPIMLAFLATVLLAACGGSSGGGSSSGSGSGTPTAMVSATCDGTDVFTLGSASFTEALSSDGSACDPQIRAAYFPANVGGSGLPEGISLTVHWDWRSASSSFNNFISIVLYGSPTPPATFPIAGSAAPGTSAGLLVENVLDGPLTPCPIASGSFTLDTYGAVGGKIAGTMSGMAVASGCASLPTSPSSGTYSANRDIDLTTAPP